MGGQAGNQGGGQDDHDETDDHDAPDLKIALEAGDVLLFVLDGVVVEGRVMSVSSSTAEVRVDRSSGSDASFPWSMTAGNRSLAPMEESGIVRVDDHVVTVRLPRIASTVLAISKRRQHPTTRQWERVEWKYEPFTLARRWVSVRDRVEIIGQGTPIPQLNDVLHWATLYLKNQPIPHTCPFRVVKGRVILTTEEYALIRYSARLSATSVVPPAGSAATVGPVSAGALVAPSMMPNASAKPSIPSARPAGSAVTDEWISRSSWRIWSAFSPPSRSGDSLTHHTDSLPWTPSALSLPLH